VAITIQAAKRIVIFVFPSRACPAASPEGARSVSSATVSNRSVAAEVSIRDAWLACTLVAEWARRLQQRLRDEAQPQPGVEVKSEIDDEAWKMLRSLGYLKPPSGARLNTVEHVGALR